MKTNRRIILVLVVAGVMWRSNVWAGDLTPPGAPQPTMHTLEEIYRKTASLEQQLQELQLRLSQDGKYATLGNMVLVPDGSFMMGATTNLGHEAGNGETPRHSVQVDAYYIDQTETTKAKWDEVRTWAVAHSYSIPAEGGGKAVNHPVHSVSWYDAVKWCNARSEMDGFTPCYMVGSNVYRSGVSDVVICDLAANGYRLPTEAEWEKAARGGLPSQRFPWGDSQSIQHARANYFANTSYSYDTSPTVGLHPSYNSLPTPYTSPVGSFAPNAMGIHDMSGNVYEWCWDEWLRIYTTSPVSNPTGPSNGSTLRVIRGGAYNSPAEYVRCAYRNADSASSTNEALGFRTVRRP